MLGASVIPFSRHDVDPTSRCSEDTPVLSCVYFSTQLRDFTGAVTLLEFNRRSAEDETLEDTLMWLGYCSFHLGNYQKAIDAYKVRREK